MSFDTSDLTENEMPAGEEVKKLDEKYIATAIVGKGVFGVVYRAEKETPTGGLEVVAIKRQVLDPRFKNRELEIFGRLQHPCVVTLFESFYNEEGGAVVLNLVMELVPYTLLRVRHKFKRAGHLVPFLLTKVYMYQVFRAVAYLHSLGICHRDIAPDNFLLDTVSHQIKLCDFGSSKALVPGCRAAVSYICGRYYRAPELVFEANDYTNAIDTWGVGCILGELLRGSTLFRGESGVDQLIEIVKVLGTPTVEQLVAMNPNHHVPNLPDIPSMPWSRVFRHAPAEAIDLASKTLVYEPTKRIDPFEAMAHPFFDELRMPGACISETQPLPSGCTSFTNEELRMASERKLTDRFMHSETRALLKEHGRPHV